MASGRPDADVLAVKRQVSRAVLNIEGVSGVGAPKGFLTVYLLEDNEEVREKVKSVLKSIAPRAELKFVVTGRLVKQSTTTANAHDSRE